MVCDHGHVQDNTSVSSVLDVVHDTSGIFSYPSTCHLKGQHIKVSTLSRATSSVQEGRLKTKIRYVETEVFNIC